MEDLIRAGISTGIKRWQWNLVIRCWGMEKAGIPERCIAGPEWVDNVFQELGVNSTSMRQLPIRAWQDGKDACHALCRFPGKGTSWSGRPTLVPISNLHWASRPSAPWTPS